MQPNVQGSLVASTVRPLSPESPTSHGVLPRPSSSGYVTHIAVKNPRVLYKAARRVSIQDVTLTPSTDGSALMLVAMFVEQRLTRVVRVRCVSTQIVVGTGCVRVT